MNMRYFALIIASVFILSSATAQEKQKTAKSGKSYTTLVSATMQRTIPGMKGAQPSVRYDFILKWKSKQVPETFFWRGDNVWMNCLVKAYKPGKKEPGEEIGLDKVKRNTCLQLTGIPGGKFPIPEEIQNTKGQAIFFKTATSGWRYLPVTSITKKKDIIAP